MPELKLRGLCSFLDVDSYFTMITSGLKNRRYHMQGWTHSSIEWDDGEEEWQIRSVKHSGVIGSCNDTTDYPLGTHRWYFKDQLCSEERQSYRLLNMHSCLDGEIPCRNGDCIAVESRFSTNLLSLAVHMHQVRQTTRLHRQFGRTQLSDCRPSSQLSQRLSPSSIGTFQY